MKHEDDDIPSQSNITSIEQVRGGTAGRWNYSAKTMTMTTNFCSAEHLARRCGRANGDGGGAAN